MAKKKNEVSILRSSTAEYLTFLTATGQGDVNAVYSDENVWLSQKMMGTLYDVESHTINYHLQKIFKDGEIDKEAVTRNFRVTARLKTKSRPSRDFSSLFLTFQLIITDENTCKSLVMQGLSHLL